MDQAQKIPRTFAERARASRARRRAAGEPPVDKVYLAVDKAVFDAARTGLTIVLSVPRACPD